VLITIIFFFVFGWRFNDGLSKLATYLPRHRRERIIAIAMRMDQAVGDFFRGRLLIAAIVGIALSLGWLLTGVPYWFFLGILTGILTIVPYLSLVTWPAAIVLKYVDALTGGSGADAGVLAVLVWPSVVYFVILFLEGWVLTPWIQGNQAHMSAATVLLVVFIGGHVGGVAGLLFSIPIAACIKILFEEVFLPRFRRWAVTV
jgi:predicted PurR-regulated permease PerM